MSDLSFPERLFALGYTDLVSVIPPGAQLVPSSTISASAVGKIPGIRHPSGLWSGYNWRAWETTAEHVKRWVSEGANIGLRAARWPAFDIDCTDANLAQMIEDAIIGQLGPAPVRYGRAPKRLLMYKLGDKCEPFGRMRLWIETPTGEKHLVEVLANGQQYLVDGMHPSGARYRWTSDPAEVGVLEISAEDASAALDYVAQLVEMTGIGTVTRVSDGRRGALATGDQDALRAPSLDVLRQCVGVIPNDDTTAPGRDEYIRMGYAIRAAAGEENESDAYDIFAAWAGSHEKDGRVSGNPDTWRSDWRRIEPPYSVGWAWLCEMARPYGFNDAQLDFTATAPAPDDTKRDGPPEYSDQWLAESLVERYRGVLRYVPARSAWLVWDTSRWLMDDTSAAEDLIRRGLQDIAIPLMRQGATAQAKAQNKKRADAICSAGKVDAVAKLIRVDRSIAVPQDALDHDPWLLNTPAGIVDLRTGVMSASDPDALMTKQTLAAPTPGLMPEFSRFITEATGGDDALIGFLQRYVGYALTGVTYEQQLCFMFGQGGNGKGTFLNVLTDLFGDYAKSAGMETFTASHTDRHTTELARLVGARLVTASEVEGGKRWNEQRVKSVTGGDPITARFMRQDDFTFRPTFKLLFIGNDQPELRGVGPAMRRRLHMVPFNITPKVVDNRLEEKLRAEYPVILAWMIEGCLAWQRDGLNPPDSVRAATAEYFEAEDAIGAWLEERVEQGPGLVTETQSLFRSWTEWANARNEHVGTVKRFSHALSARGFARWRGGEDRRRGFEGLRLRVEDQVRLMA